MYLHAKALWDVKGWLPSDAQGKLAEPFCELCEWEFGFYSAIIYKGLIPILTSSQKKTMESSMIESNSESQNLD